MHIFRVLPFEIHIKYDPYCTQFFPILRTIKKSF